ncbi:MAG: TonB-dependent receptor, partial [Pseudorhodoplanes sp.]
RVNIDARDTFNVNAPGALNFDVAGEPFNRGETNKAYHLGAEHRFNEAFGVFGRMAQSFRVPNVDERVGAVEALTGVPTTFDLRTHKSRDWEGGVKLHVGGLNVQWSMYDMRLTDEIHFRYGQNFATNNTNLDPTRRYGHETIASYAITEQLRLKGGLSFTRAVFRAGEFAGNDVPLVSKWTGSGGVYWDIWQKWLTLDTVVRYIGSRRMDNDQTNLQPLIPAHTLVDLRLGGVIEKFFWSFSVQNLFDKFYYDYSIASPFPNGFQSQLNTYNAYSQPGHTYMVKAGVTW